MRRMFLIATACVGAACCGSAYGQIDPNDFCLQGEWPFGRSSELAVDAARGLAFFASGQRIVVVDASNPEQTGILSDTIEPASSALDLFYDGGTERLYIATGIAGLEIWDVSNPATPTFLGSAHPMFEDLIAPVKGVIAVGEWAYVTTTYRGVTWIDVSEPTNPIVGGGISLFPTTGGPPDSSPNDLVVGDDGLVYVTGRNTGRLFIEPDGSLRELWVIQGGGDDIFVANGVAYVIRNSLGLYTYDLEVAYPRLVFADQDDRFITGVATQGDVAYVAMFASSGLAILDVSDPYHLTDIGTFPVSAPNAVRRAGNTLYLVNDSGLTTLEITDPTSPALLDQIGTGGFFVGELVVSGTHAFSTSGDVHALDISDPANPVPVGHYDAQRFANGLTRDGNLLFVNEQATDPATSAVTVLDIADPTNPTLKSRYTGVEQPVALVSRDNLLYVAESPIFPARTGGLRLLDISDPNNLSEVGYTALGVEEEAVSLAVAGNYAYVGALIFGAGTDGIRVVDVSDPTQPRRMGFVAAPGEDFPKDLSADGGRLYAAVLDDGLVAYDLSTPSNPAQTGWYHPADYVAYRVVARGTTVYLAGSELRVLDLANPAQPQVLVTEPSPEFFSVGLAVTETQVVAGYGDAGARVFGTCAGIPGDLDGDGDVDLSDLAQLLAHYPTAAGASYEDGDLDGDGDVDLSDLAALLANYGAGL